MLNLLTNFFLKILSYSNGLIQHNIEKNKAIRLIFWWAAVENVIGDYVEFGVATGNSIKGAVLAEAKAHSKKLFIKRVERNIYGFDTFERFSSNSRIDIHPNWSGTSFSDSFENVSRRFKKDIKVTLFQVDVLDIKTPINKNGDDKFSKTISRIAIAMFDMDLYEPTRNALEFIYPKISVGSVLVFDEYFGFQGKMNSDEFLALKEFLEYHKNLQIREFISYGMGGKAFIVVQI